MRFQVGAAPYCTTVCRQLCLLCSLSGLLYGLALLQQAATKVCCDVACCCSDHVKTEGGTLLSCCQILAAWVHWRSWAGWASCSSRVRDADATPATPSAAYAGQRTFCRKTIKPCHGRPSSILPWRLAVC